MVLDKDLLRVALDAARQMVDRERELERAKGEYHQAAVRRLHHSGGTSREIATALGLSHQRVHQIVHKPRPWR